MESMQDHKQHRDDKSINPLNKVSIFIGSQQTQHVELHNDDLDHDRQLTDLNMKHMEEMTTIYCYGPVV
jgi:hypothetical protein